MRGYLVTNHFLNSEKFSEITRYLMASAERFEIELYHITNAELISKLPADSKAYAEYFAKESISFVLFWDKDIRLAKLIEKAGVRVFNSADAIERCDDKSLCYISLINSNIPMPETVISPKTFFKVERYPESFIKSLEEKLGYPMVVKERYGSFGAQVYLAKSSNELENIIAQTSPSELIFQKFIRESFGRDYRLNVVGDRVVTAMERYNDDDFRANLTNGGSMKPYTPTKEQEKLAISVCRALELDFAGVDILACDPPLLCEVNSNAHFVNIYNCTGVNVADHIMEYINRKVGK